jgi:hypothetical protein
VAGIWEATGCMPHQAELSTIKALLLFGSLEEPIETFGTFEKVKIRK